jgi:hypothetical protein
MSKPMKPAAIDLSKINHEKLKKKIFKSGQSTEQALINYNKGPFYIQTPPAKAPFGVSIGKIDEKKPNQEKKYYILVDLDDPDFKNKALGLDKKNIEFISSQSQEWWGEKSTIEEIRKFCYTSLAIKSKSDKDKDKKDEYSDKFKIKLTFFEGVPQFKVYDQYNNLINWCKPTKDGPPELDWSWAQPHMIIETIIQCECLWIIDKKVYCSFKAVQIRVKPPQALPECAFDDVVEIVNGVSNISVEEKNSPPPPSVSDEESDKDLKVEDDDEDTDGDDEGEVAGKE